jgi:signal transduction histidine kinase
MNLKRLRIIFSLVMGLLILLCVWTYWNLNNYIKTVGNIRQANLTIRTNTQVLSLIKDAETGHRGYQLTHDEEYLKPYYQARIQLPEELERLDSLSTFIPSIKVPVKQLEGLIDIQLNTIEQILRSTKWKNSFLETEEVRLLQEGKNNMDLIRNVGDLINHTARRIASTAIEDEGGFKTLTPVNLLVVALIAFGGVLLLFTRAVMLLEDRDKKSQTLEKAVQDLQEETQKRIHTSNLLRSVLDNSKEGIMALTAVRNDAGEIVDFDFVLVNEASAKMAQRSQGQMIEKKLSEIFPQSKESLLEEYAKVPDTGLDFRTEIEIELNGELVWFKILAVKFNDGIVVTFSDITKEKEAELQLRNYTQELKRSNEDLEQFAYVASHDLQEPLRKIRSFGDRLITKYHDKLDETGQDYIERMHVAAGRMQHLIEDLLAFSRITRSSELPAKIDLRGLFEEIADDLSDQISREGARLEIEKMPAILGVRGQIRRLFQNLVSNAIKFRKQEESPLIRVEGKKMSALEVTQEYSIVPRFKDYVKISVLDNGIGFDEKYTEQIFNVFQRLHGKYEFEGTGIGLAICKKIVSHHGGIITAKSKEGIGSEFIVILPISN